MSIDIISEELIFFKAATTRMRWLVNTTVLISALIMVHIYLANFSLQSQQLKGLSYNRFMNQSFISRECQGTVFLELIKDTNTNESYRQKKKNQIIETSPLCAMISSGSRKELISMSLNDLVKQYSILEYEIQSNEHTLADERLPVRTIPILNMSIPANDFVIVMAILSMFIVIGIWMNLRGIHAALLSLCSHKDLDIIKVAQLNTVFLTYSEVGGNSFAKKVRAVSMWFPFISIVSATLVSNWPIFQARLTNNSLHYRVDYYNGSDAVIIIFLSLSILISSMHFWIALKCYKEIKSIDFIFKINLKSK